MAGPFLQRDQVGTDVGDLVLAVPVVGEVGDEPAHLEPAGHLGHEPGEFPVGEVPQAVLVVVGDVGVSSDRKMHEKSHLSGDEGVSLS